MKPEDKEAFQEILGAVYELRGSRALSQLSATEKFLPMPSQVIDVLEPSGWPSPAEAWAMAPVAERETYAVHDELQAAWASAAGLWDDGDKIGARRAFESAYKRISEASKARGIRRPQWRLSIGFDARLRSAGAQLAVDRGLGFSVRSGPTRLKSLYLPVVSCTSAARDAAASGSSGDCRPGDTHTVGRSRVASRRRQCVWR